MQAFTTELHHEHSQLLHLVTHTLDKLQDQQGLTLKNLSALEPLLQNTSLHINENLKLIAHSLQESLFSKLNMDYKNIQDQQNNLLDAFSSLRPTDARHSDIRPVEESLQHTQFTCSQVLDNLTPPATLESVRHALSPLDGNLLTQRSKKRKRTAIDHKTVAGHNDNSVTQPSIDPSSPHWRLSSRTKISKKTKYTSLCPPNKYAQRTEERTGPCMQTARQRYQLRARKATSYFQRAQQEHQSEADNYPPLSTTFSEGAIKGEAGCATRPSKKTRVPQVAYLTRQAIQQLNLASPNVPSIGKHENSALDSRTTLSNSDSPHPSPPELRRARFSELSCIALSPHHYAEANHAVNPNMNAATISNNGISAVQGVGQAESLRKEEVHANQTIIRMHRVSLSASLLA